MKVPLGNFGNTIAEPVAQPNKGAAFSHAADVIDNVMQVQQSIEERAQRNREALQRAKAANAFASYQYDVENTGRDIEEGMAAGTVDYEHAQEEFDARVKKLPPPQVQLDNPVDRENHSAALTITQNRQRQALAPAIFAARQRDGVAQLDQFFDTQAKRAIEPEANVEAINASADAFGANARAYGLPENLIAARVQNFKDANWFNNARQRAIESADDYRGLEKLKTDLTTADGYYAGKLDPEKRNAVLASVQGAMDRIELRAANNVDRREAKATRAAAQIERQISSGVPATPEMWTDWASTIKGTSVEPEFNDLVHNERETQAVLRAPLAEQDRLLQQRESDLYKNGGTVVQKANLERLRGAIATNRKSLREQPLVFAEERLGRKNEPVDITTIFDPGTQAEAASTFHDRAATIDSLGRQFGARVPLRPLLPQEAQQLSQLMESGAPAQVTELYAKLRDAAGSPDIFRGMMNQVAPDQPVKALAGVLSSMQRDLTTTSHWFKPDETITARDVAATMLEGDRLINRSSTAKAEDGKPQNRLVLPETKPLQEAFESVVGDNFRGDPQGKERAFQAAHAFYVGRVAQTGVRAKDGSSADKRLMELAVKSTLGDIVNFNSHGNVQAPWGMSGGDFEDRAERAIRSQSKTAGIADKDVNENIRALGLDNGPSDGIYVLTRAGQWLYDGRGNPVLIDIRPPDARDARGIIKRNGQ